MTTKINVGGGPGWNHPGWTNLDAHLGYDVREKFLTGFVDRSVRTIFCSHMLEHLPPADARRLLVDCYRVLEPGGLIRLVLPDCAIFAKAFRIGDLAFFNRPTLKPHFGTPADCLIGMGGHQDSFDLPSGIGHWWFWTADTLTWLLVLAGFRSIELSSFGASQDSGLNQVAACDSGGMPIDGFDNPLTADISFYLEARR